MGKNTHRLNGLDADIADAHQRFLVAMAQRLPNMNVDTKERYFVVLSSLVGKLESDGKTLHDVVREMLTETAAYLFQEIGMPG